ncbi:MAG: cell division protein ZipA C-terminal FtsZ-binding domain-containing protein [Burkholderiales bacterium]|nr:cell division protein ZipA C-terminal FtsZ-binding domain-containing protein [Burkholderiales bacterium]
MSDLQISLLVIGVVVVGAVYLFNWAQERKLRRKLEQAFGAEHDDVLLRTAPLSPAADQRIEPQLPPLQGLSAATPEDGTETTLPEPEQAPIAIAREALAPGLDPTIDFIARIDASTPVSDALIGELLSKIAVCGKPARGAGFNADAGQWEDLVCTGGGRYARLCLALQLVNRTGPVNSAQLAAFCDAIKSCAGRIPAAVTLPGIGEALALARALDGFCAEVDVAVGINIVAPESGAFSGTKIRALAEAAGFKLEPEGVFHYRNDERRTLFTLDNHEPAPFIPEQIKSLSTTGITLLLDVPRVADGQKAFDRMVEIGRSFAQTLGGRLVDDNRVALNDPGIAKIRRQLGAIYAKMEARGIQAGSERALRLFS